jgi:hypothetical protein
MGGGAVEDGVVEIGSGAHARHSAR